MGRLGFPFVVALVRAALCLHHVVRGERRLLLCCDMRWNSLSLAVFYLVMDDSRPAPPPRSFELSRAKMVREPLCELCGFQTSSDILRTSCLHECVLLKSHEWLYIGLVFILRSCFSFRWWCWYSHAAVISICISFISFFRSFFLFWIVSWQVIYTAWYCRKMALWCARTYGN